MDILVFDRNLNLIGNIDTYETFEFNRKFQKVGEFQFYVSANKENMEFLKKDNIIYKNNGYEEEAGIIEVVEREMDKTYEIFRVAGNLSSSYLARRISLKQIIFNGKIEELIYKMIDENAITPEDVRRILPDLRRANLKGFSETIDYEKSYGNLIDEMEKILERTEIGFRTVFNPIEKHFTFELYKGVDRTVNQSDRAPCIFSNEFENIYNEHYILDKREYKNTALVAGQGEGIERKKVLINDTNKGIDRYELFVDARNIPDKKFDDSGTGSETLIPIEQYMKLLEDRGKLKLSDHTIIENFECDTNALGNNKYKIDYDLGDKITIFSNKWNMQIDAIITEIDEIYENGNLEVKVGLGTPKQTLANEIKRLRKE